MQRVPHSDVVAQGSDLNFAGFSRPTRSTTVPLPQTSFRCLNLLSEQPDCRQAVLTDLADAKMSLPDLSTENFTILGKLMDRVHELVQYYSTDGLRTATAKRIRKTFLARVLQGCLRIHPQ